MSKALAIELEEVLLEPKLPFNLVDKKYVNIIRKFPGEIILMSNHSPKFCKKINSKLKTKENYICYNGALVIKNSKILAQQTLKKIHFNSLYTYINDTYSNIVFYLYDENHRVILSGNNNVLNLYVDTCIDIIKNLRLNERKIISRNATTQILNDSSNLYMAVIKNNKYKEEILNQLKIRYSDYFNFLIESDMIYISPKGINKNEGLKLLTASFEIDNNNTYVIGNKKSSLPFLDNFNNCFALNKGNEQFKSKAKHIIGSFNEINTFIN